VPVAQRVPFGLVIDEFHNFTTDSFASILAEIRKYGAAIVLSHQYIAQLTPAVRDAVFGNVGTFISFRVGESDAAVLAREFGSDFAPDQFTDLENFEVCVKLLDGGVQREPFVGKTHAPATNGYGKADNIIRRSREKYAVSRAVVEEKIRRWMESRK
jgi:Type IV secretion-system coupling protein DNA-binding domain